MDNLVKINNLLQSQAFKLKGRLYTFTVLQLLTNDKAVFTEQLDEVIAKAPRFFDNTPVVIDCSKLHDMELDLAAFCQCLRNRGLMPVAVQGATSLLATLAQCNGMAILNASAAQDKTVFDTPDEDAAASTDTSKNKLLTHPIRSGQQAVSKGGDLIITASVSHGAELLADGNIHVYGALRGRALAGISGDKNARIFCQSLEAELVSIAGFYRLSDSLAAPVGACQIYLQDEQIKIEPLC